MNNFPQYCPSNMTSFTMKDEIDQMLIDAYYNKRKINYIIVGDSLRAGSTVPTMYQYYRTLFSQINVDVVLSAAAGMYCDLWRASTSPSTIARLTYTIANCLGTDGEDTIIEFGLGVNDHSVHGAGAVVGEVKQAIADILAQKPKVKIVLVAPPISGTLQRGLDTLASYQQLSTDLGYPLINGFEATKYIYCYASASNSYYSEATHYNENGGRRFVNYIVNHLMPPGLSWIFSLPEFSGVESETALVNQAVVETGMYQSTGTALAGATWRRLDELNVTGRTLLKIQHQGSRRDIIWKDASNVHTLQNLPTLLDGQTYWLIEVPETAVTLKVNIETVNATAYDALGDVPIVQNVVPATAYVMPKEKINIGLNLRIK